MTTQISVEDFQERADAARRALALACGRPLDTSVSDLLDHGFKHASLYNRTQPGETVNAMDTALETFSRTTLNLCMNFAKQHLPPGFDRVPAV